MVELRTVVGQRIREARLRITPRVSQQGVARQLAKLTGTNPASMLRNIKRWESGRHMPDMYFRPFLAQVLDATEETLFGYAPVRQHVAGQESSQAIGRPNILTKLRTA